MKDVGTGGTELGRRGQLPDGTDCGAGSADAGARARKTGAGGGGRGGIRAGRWAGFRAVG
ncbi:hypothetical protein FTUN_1966 [Frigoriglobus tundricola]|uniref:Uncharacterized protein n=1 Tax=Frigoriglobus tundricola TaxID=2774151 RepID=A0A6M5YM85_9BACT|nr:hypothetical protein FTUN_1966 [Frigoriglobus tundricola]